MWTKKLKITKQEECHLLPEIQPSLNENVSPREIFSLVTSLEKLLELIVEQSNLYTYKNERNFLVNKEKLKAFLEINFVMAINKLPTIAESWRVDNLISNVGIRSTMIRNHFCKILQNLHFADNRKDDKTDEACKMRPAINHLNSKFFEMLSNDNEQKTDEHRVKFKGRYGMKEYIKSKPIKWGFKFWFLCSSKSGYLYQMDINLGRNETPEFNLDLGEEVVLQLTKDVERSFCTVYFDNFFNSPTLIEKLFQKSIYGIGTIWANGKQMPKRIDDKQMNRADCEFIFSGNKMAGKWMGIDQCCFYHLSLNEWMTYQFRGDKRVQRPSLRFLFLRLQLSKRYNFLLEVIKIIPTNQLTFCLICHFN